MNDPVGDDDPQQSSPTLARREYLKAAGVAGLTGSALTTPTILSTAQQSSTAATAEPLYTHTFEDGPGFDTITGHKIPGNATHTTETAHSGTGSLRVAIPSGSHWGIGGTIDPVEDGLVDTELTSMYISYWLKFDPEYDATADNGKLPGPANTESGAAHGGKTDGVSWSARGRFDAAEGDNVAVGYYCYHLDQSGTYGDVITETPVSRGEWHHIEQFISLNTTDGGTANADGQLKMWIDGTQTVNRERMRFTTQPDRGVNFWMDVYYGGGTPSPRTNHIYFDDLVIAPAPTDARHTGNQWTPDDYTPPDAGSRNPDTTTDYPNSITLVDNQSRKDTIDTTTTEYEFTVTGDITKTTAMDATTDADDTIDNGTVSGRVDGDADSYAFSGQLSSFSIDGDATIYLNDEQVSPNTLRELDGHSTDSHVHRVTIDGTETTAPVDYTVTATGDILSDADDSNDTITDGTVTGTVADDTDSYLFTGNLTAVQIQGAATMSVTRSVPISGPGDATSTPPTSDDALMHVGFEDGITDGRLDGVYTIQGDTGVPHNDDALEVVSEPTRAGDAAVKIHIDADWDFESVNSTRANSVLYTDVKQDLHDRGFSNWREPFWFSCSLYVPDDWTPDSVTESLIEFHRDASENPNGLDRGDWEPGRGKAVSVRMHNDNLVVLTDYKDSAGNTQRDEATTPVTAGNWYDIVMHIKWSHAGDDDTGFIKTWVNGEQIYEHTGNTAANDIAPPRPPKFGIYKWDWDNGTIDQSTRTYYFDEFRFGDATATYDGMRPGPRQ